MSIDNYALRFSTGSYMVAKSVPFDKNMLDGYNKDRCKILSKELHNGEKRTEM